MLKDGSSKVDRCEVATFINNFFINVGKVDKELTPLYNNTDCESVLSEDVIPYSLTQVYEREVSKVVRSINVSKSSGLDNINSTTLKIAFEFLIPELTHMYNLSIRSEKFPDSWKKALVVPIPKKGNLTKVQNYRPISLLPLPGKIMEKLVHQHFSMHMETNSLLAAEQHGFRKNHSTVHSVAQLTNYIHRRLSPYFNKIAIQINDSETE